MAKNYQRHSKGGRFKRADIGDAGISSLRQQQQNIIDAIKLQKAQDKDISRDQLAGMRETAQTEDRNRRTLADLESTIYSVKRENIQKRQKTEVDRLEDQAKEYEKQAQFWKDFSTTYSKQYGEAAKEVWDFKDRMWANKYAQFVIDQIPNQINFKADNLKKGIEDTLEDSLREAAKVKLAKADKEGQKAIVKEQKTILRTMHGGNKYLDDIKVRAFTDQINQIEENLRRTIIESPDLKWEPHTIIPHYQQAALNLIIKSGIKPNSSAARQLHALFTRKGTAAAHKLDLKQDAIKDKEVIDTNAYAIRGLPVEKQPQALKELFLNVKNATRQDSNGKFTIGMDNNKEAYWATAQILAEYYTDEKAFVKAMQSMLVDSGKKGVGDVAWNVRFEKQSAQEQLRLEEIWLDVNKDKIAEDTNRQKLKDKAGEAKFKTIIGAEDFDLTRKADKEVLENLKKEYPHPETIKLVDAALAFNFEGKNETYVTEQLLTKWSKGESAEFLEVYNLSNSKFKERYKELAADMNALLEVDPTGKGITGWAQSQILNKSKVLSFNQPNAKGLDLVVNAYENVFYQKFNELKDVTDPNQRWAEAKKHADDQLADTENGIFRRSEKNSIVTWHAFTPEADTSWSAADIDAAVGISEVAVPGAIQNIIDQHKKGTKKLITQDEEDYLLRNIAAGKTNSIPKDIKHLWSLKNDKKDGETIEDFARDILNTDKLTIPKGTFSLYEYTNKLHPLKIPNQESYSDDEVASIHGIRRIFENVWPIRQTLSNTIASIGGIEFISEEDNYAALDRPENNYNYFGIT